MANDSKPVKLDQIDVQILEILQKTGRITNAKLAQEVGLSAPPMLERVKKLERSGVIKSYRAVIDAKKVGRNFLVFVAVNLDVSHLHDVSKFENTIAKKPEVLECHHIAGDIDFMLKVCVHDQEHFKNFVIGELSGIEGIKGIRSWVVLATSKETTELDLAHALNK